MISNELRSRFGKAFREYVKTHRIAVENRDLLTASDVEGGALISMQFNEQLNVATKVYGPIVSLVNYREVEKFQTVKTTQVDPTVNNFTVLTEGSTAASSLKQQPTMSSEVLSADTLLSSIVLSRQFVSDSEFDIFDWLVKNIAPGVARAKEGAILLGTDSHGSALGNSPSGGLIGATFGETTTEASGDLADGPTFALMSSLAASIDRSYWSEGSYLVSPNTEAWMREQVDSTGRELYAVGDDGFLTVAGRKVYPGVGIPDYDTASSVIALFGSWQRFWSTVATSVRVKVVNESPTLNINEVELLVYFRIANTPGVASAAAKLVSAAS